MFLYTDNQQKVYYDEDYEKHKCDQCNSGFLKKWMVAKHVKDTHKVEKSYDQPQIDGRFEYNVDIEDPSIIFFFEKNHPFLSISVRFGINATIRIGREIQCLPYAGFFV